MSNASKTLLLCIALILGLVSSFMVGRMSTWLGMRTIQILKFPRESLIKHEEYTAELRRNFFYIDVNFDIILNGERIYRSPDFKPYADKAFRAWITWDDSRKHLLFFVSDRILFAYNLESKTALPEEAFSSLIIPKHTLQDLGYEGDYPGRPSGREPAKPH